MLVQCYAARGGSNCKAAGTKGCDPERTARAMSRIFISYSHRGKGPEWKAALLRALHVFDQHHLLDVWQDGKIRVSSFWDGDIKQAMSSARLAVVLMTKEALELRRISSVLRLSTGRA